MVDLAHLIVLRYRGVLRLVEFPSINHPDSHVRLPDIHRAHLLINDVIAPTADPRIPFGGRGASGYGVTRGAEGLLAMTTPRTIQVQRGRPRRAYEATGEGHAELFAALKPTLAGAGAAQVKLAHPQPLDSKPLGVREQL